MLFDWTIQNEWVDLTETNKYNDLAALNKGKNHLSPCYKSRLRTSYFFEFDLQPLGTGPNIATMRSNIQNR